MAGKQLGFRLPDAEAATLLQEAKDKGHDGYSPYLIEIVRARNGAPAPVENGLADALAELRVDLRNAEDKITDLDTENRTIAQENTHLRNAIRALKEWGVSAIRTAARSLVTLPDVPKL